MSAQHRPISWLFGLGAVYDALLGAAFLLVPGVVFSQFHVPPPNHWGYVQFPGALLLIFALMFLAVARAPMANRNLIPFGIWLKVAYSGTVFAYWFSPTGIPNLWKPFAVIDLLFGVLFFVAWRTLGEKAAN